MAVTTLRWVLRRPLWVQQLIILSPLGLLLAVLLAVALQAADVEGNQWVVNFALGIAAIVVSSAIIAYLAPRLLVLQFREFQTAFERLAQGDLSVQIEKRGNNEFQNLVNYFNLSTQRISTQIATLENRLHERIRDLEITSEISREVAGLRNIDVLLNRAINLIIERLGYYHAQVFLLDDRDEFAVLVASTGDAGKRLLAKKHKLAVGSASVIGKVTSFGMTVIAGDTAANEVPWRPNPELPNTRSEMALPLKVENRVIGALDIQSLQPEDYDSSTIEIFQILADQLAIAISNARLITELEQRVVDVAILNQQLTRQSWEEFSREHPEESHQAFQYDLLNVKPYSPEQTEEKPASTGHRASVEIGGNVFGIIEAIGADKPLSRDDRSIVNAVAGRVALAIESARLFQQTQSALADSQRLYEMARAINSAAEFDIRTVYGLVTEQLIYREALDHVALLIAEPIPSFFASHLRIAHLWNKTAEASTWKIGETLSLLQDGLSLCYEETPREIILIEKTGALIPAHKAYTALKKIQNDLNAASVLLIPMVVGLKWLGILICGSRQEQAFPPRFQDFAGAVADQLAVAIENRRLFEEVQNEARRALALTEVGKLASQISGDLSGSLTRVFRLVSGPGEFDRWWFGVLDASGSSLQKVVASEHGFPTFHDLQNDHNALIEAIHAKTVLLVNEFDEDHPVLGKLKESDRVLYGKHLALPVTSPGEQVIGALLIGREVTMPDLDERDIQLATTLASQLGVAMENRRLFVTAESQRAMLQKTIEAMPAGVLLLAPDGRTTLSNHQVVELLGSGITKGLFAPNTYAIFKAGINELYEPDQFPTALALKEKTVVTAENIFVEHPSGRRINLLVNAAPIRNDSGEVVSVVAIFQEITELRELEKALQASLSETTALYEASRMISTSTNTDEIIEAVKQQLHSFIPDHMYIIFQEGEEYGGSVTPSLVAVCPEMPLEKLKIDQLSIPHELLLSDDMIVLDSTENGLGTLPRGFNMELSKKAAQRGVRSLAVLPLKTRGRTLGWISVGFEQVHQFISEERRFLTTVADQATIALNSIRLFQSTQSALRTVANLYRASRRIAEAQGTPDALGVMREELLAFKPDRIDVLLQRNTDQPESLYLAVTWAKETSLQYVPSLPVETETAEALAGFDPLSLEDHIIQNIQTEHHDDSFVDALRILDTPYQAFLSVPLRASGRTVGRIGMAFLQPRYFSPDDRQLVSMLASAAAYTIENDLLFRQTQESLEETGVLYQASRAIAASEERSDIVQAVIDYAASAPVDKAMLITLLSNDWHEPGAVIEITTTWGDNDTFNLRGLRFTPDQFPLWDLLAAPEILWVNDVENSLRLDENTRMGCRAMDIGSFVVIPLNVPSRPIGAILIASAEPRVHDAREIRIYQSLADQAAVQLENRNLYEQAELRARQLGTTAEVSRAATSILQLEELFPRIVNLILEAFNYDIVQIFMLDDAQENAVLKASTGEAGRQLLEIKHSLPVGSRSVIGMVTSTGRSQIALDTADAGVVHRPNPFLPETRSEMAIPLIVKGKVVGALDVQSNRPRAFNEDDLKTLTTLADQLAVAIDNAQLFALSQQRAAEMKFLFDTTSAATAAKSLNESMTTLAELLIHQTGATIAMVFLYSKLRQHLFSQTIVENIDERGFTQVLEREVIIKVGQGLIGEVARTLQPIVVPDLRSEPLAEAIFTHTRSAVYLPLLSGEELVGAIALESRRTDYFNTDTLQLLQALGTTVSTIVKNTQLLDELRRTNERLLEIDKLKTNFLAAMSHELRTPLNSIIGFSRVILKGIDGPINEMQQQDIQTIHDSGKHLLRLVNDILDQAKVAAGKMELSLDYFDLVAVIKSSMSSAVGLTKDKAIRLFTEIEDGMSTAYGDEFRTRQILFNLLSNAAKFTHEGSITTSAYVITSETGHQFIQISVTDTGIGIHEKDFDKLFEAFQQVDNSTTRAVEGTGLGLPLARSLAELQGGSLWVESEVGVGSTFYVTVPTQPMPKAKKKPEGHPSENGEEAPIVEVTEEPAPEKAARPSLSPADHTKKVILVADDELGMITLYRRYLSKEGWQIVGVSKPETIEEKIAYHNPQLILLDIQMPGRDGWQVLESLKTNPATFHIPVVVCSIETDTERSQRLGAVAHLTKPFVEESLLKTVREVATSQLH